MVPKRRILLKTPIPWRLMLLMTQLVDYKQLINEQHYFCHRSPNTRPTSRGSWPVFMTCHGIWFDWHVYGRVAIKRDLSISHTIPWTVKNKKYCLFQFSLNRREMRQWITNCKCAGWEHLLCIIWHTLIGFVLSTCFVSTINQLDSLEQFWRVF